MSALLDGYQVSLVPEKQNKTKPKNLASLQPLPFLIVHYLHCISRTLKSGM